MESHAVRSIFLAKYLLRNKPDDPALEKLLTRLREEPVETTETNEK